MIYKAFLDTIKRTAWERRENAKKTLELMFWGISLMGYLRNTCGICPGMLEERLWNNARMLEELFLWNFQGAS